MNITDVRCDKLAIPGRVFQRRKGLPDQPTEKDAFLFRIVAENGLEGHCLWDRNGSVMQSITERHIRPLVSGRDPLEHSRIWYTLWEMKRVEYFPLYVMGVVDIALWDLVGKILELPVYRLLGGYRDTIPVYASTHSYQSVDEYRHIVDHSLEKGYRAIKLHGPGVPEEDLEICRKVREWVGEGFPLMFDATGSYTYEQALPVGRELEELDYLWYEEPLRDSHAHLLRQLADKLDIPLLVAESSDESLFDTANQILGRTGTMIHGDPFIKAGITGVMKTASLCEAFGMTYQIHHSEAYGLHASCAMKNTLYYEQIVPEDTFHFDFQRDRLSVDENGHMAPSDRPGFGLDLDLKRMERHIPSD